MVLVYECYYCGKEYVAVRYAYKHRCRLQPNIPSQYKPVFLLKDGKRDRQHF